jgi:phosphoglycolate phosphatase
MPETLPTAAIAFDLDGTLIDSAADIGNALNRALSAEGLGGFDVAQVIQWIGDGPDALIDRALDHHEVVEPDGNLRQRLRATYDAVSIAEPLAFGRPFAGIPELLSACQQRWPLAVVTNKPPPLARAVLGAAGLLSYFREVHGPTRRHERKPEPFMILAAARALRVEPAELLMVGDSLADLGAAAAAGCRAAYAGWGYGKPGTLDRFPDALPMATPAELLAHLTD